MFSNRKVIRVLLAFVLADCLLGAGPEFSALCTGVKDGDTVTVIKEDQPVTVRLFGIDAPELGEPYSRSAKRFLSSLVQGKEVKIEERGVDRFGRTIGRVFVGKIDVSETMLRAGLAWHLREYSADKELAEAEDLAKNAGIGIWAAAASGSLKNESTSGSRRSETLGVVYHGNIRSKVFHAPGCRYYGCKNCIRDFASRKQAIGAGFRPAGCCRP